MIDQFSAERVAFDVLAQLERRRKAIVGDEALVRAEVKEALAIVRKEYEEAELPRAYFDALSTELEKTIPAEWRALAAPFSHAEAREFGLWRGGDPIARITYVFIGLVIGGLCVELPFIPIWEKWFPFLLAGLAWWLPNAQLAYHRRRYARALGAIAAKLAQVQPRLDGTFSTEELLQGEREKAPALPPAAQTESTKKEG